MNSTSVRERFQTGGAALLRGLNFWRRGSAALPLLAGAILLTASGAKAETTNILSDAEIQGRQLAQQLLSERPAENLANSGVLKIRDKQADTRKFL